MTGNQHGSLQALRAASQAKEMADKRADVRRKSLLILVHDYLQTEGFRESARHLQSESRLVAENFTVCDNTDLSTLLNQYEQWYIDKHEKYPRFAKRTNGGGSGGGKGGAAKGGGSDILDSIAANNKAAQRRQSVPRTPPIHPLNRYSSDPNLLHDPNTLAAINNNSSKKNGNSRSKFKTRAGGDAVAVVDNRRGDQTPRRSVQGRRGPEEEKRDNAKSSSDSDSEKFNNRSAPNSSGRGRSRVNPPNRSNGVGPVTAARMGQQVLDLRSMISDYTRLEDNIGDIGKGPRVVNNNSSNKPQPPKGKGENGSSTGESNNGVEGTDLLDDRLVRSPGTGLPPHLTGDLKDLAGTIQREVLVENPGVTWEDVMGVEDAKRLLKEAVVYPLKYPQLFVGRFKPWRGVLLYGPPGTGKTLLAKAVATECKTTFFNISATTLVSKWRGDSEKLVRVLFEMARYYAPSTIFVDEVDALMGSRAGDQEHEASRRMKTQLLVEMDGLTATNDHVFLLAASNIPWELDPAMLRRLEKRILVPLPCPEARAAMFHHHLPETLQDLEEAGQIVKTVLDYQALAEMSEGYSGSDLKVVCREAAMMSLRKIFKILEDRTVGDEDLPDLIMDDITMKDVETAIMRTKPAQQDSNLYLDWHKKFGST
uniref:Katanin p60 ATPase-containing subunit A-like 2 n=2 Tax=Hirondellea gigas TaxID=1518452 RepID=A0A6A7G9E9_9CRUS